MYSLSYLSRQVEALRSRLKPVLAILKLRNLAMEFCGEFDEADSPEQPDRRQVLMDKAAVFPPCVGQAGFRLDTFQDLVGYLTRCIKGNTGPDPREIVSPSSSGPGKAPYSAPTSGSAPTPPDRKIPSRLAPAERRVNFPTACLLRYGQRLQWHRNPVNPLIKQITVQTISGRCLPVLAAFAPTPSVLYFVHPIE